MSAKTRQKISAKRRLQGNFRNGTTHSDATKRKMSLALTGRKYPNAIGHPHTPQSREKLSKANLIRFAVKENHPRFGVKLPAELLKRLSEAHMGHEHSVETRVKMSEARKGPKHWNWKPDRTSLKKSDKKHKDGMYRYWMFSVKNRDRWHCKIETGKCSGRLEAHHILNWMDYPESRYKISNGITLCHAHHPRGRAKEKRLSPYLQKLVSVSK